MRNYKKVGANGTISIPAKMRRELGIQGKDVMEVSSENGAVIIRPKSLRCLYCGSAETAGTIGGKASAGSARRKHTSFWRRKGSISYPGTDATESAGCVMTMPARRERRTKDERRNGTETENHPETGG